MSSKPDFIDLGNEKPSSPNNHPDLPSPRSGEVPPALSPLDAFALQSRLLAQQLDSTRDNGRRVSRLPPLTIANELSKPRPGYFGPTPRSAQAKSEDSPSESSGSAPTSGLAPDISQPGWRPRSHYPFVQAFDDAESITTRDSVSTIKQVQADDASESPSSTHSSTGVQRDDSIKPYSLPSELAQTLPTLEEDTDNDPSQSSTTDSIKELPPSSTSTRQKPIPGPLHLKPSDALAVPGSPPFSRSPRSLRNPASPLFALSEKADDSDSYSLQGDSNEFKTSGRKLSNSSAFSRPRSPFSTALMQGLRSPSISSEHSGQPRASINFSRPLSRAGRGEARPSYEGSVRSQALESPPLRASSESRSLHESTFDSPPLRPTPWADSATPMSLTDDEGPPGRDHFIHPNGAPSYIYAKYSLPRGRILSRNSVLNQELATHKFEWEPPRFVESNVTSVNNERSNSIQGLFPDEDRLEFRTSRLMSELTSDAPAPRSRSADAARFSQNSAKARKSDTSTLKPPQTAGGEITVTQEVEKAPPTSEPTNPITSTTTNITTATPTPTTTTTAAAANTRAPTERHSLEHCRMPDPGRLRDSLQQLTPDGHLAMGIACHEDGELLKSTYHLRLAARGGNATAMILYALACRHGWGMRANQEEGVSWLRKAVDSAGLEVADDENGEASSKLPNDILARRAHKAQFALSIYELGVSYMNGWGIGQDKQLALRCFEISGGWGDGDALAEAGFCYAKGVGCKKDLKKAADFYRRAEKQGVEMAGNSWIYKDKYMSPSAQSEDTDRKSRGGEREKKKEKRDKSRTRTIFGGKRKQQQQQQQQQEQLQQLQQLQQSPALS